MTDPLLTGARTNALGQLVGLPVAECSSRPIPVASPHEGHYCRLAPLCVDHADGLFDAFAEDHAGRIWTYLSTGPFPSKPAFRDWVAAVCGDRDPLFFTILVQGEPLGHAAFLRIKPEAASLEIGWIALSPRLQRTAAATEFQFLMMRHAFEDLGYRRYEWKCDALNAPSRRAAERLGFTYEGTFRQALHYKGRNRDTAWYSVIDSEWPARRAGFLRWLDPTNFDADGRQKSPLRVAGPPDQDI